MYKHKRDCAYSIEEEISFESEHPDIEYVAVCQFRYSYCGLDEREFGEGETFELDNVLSVRAILQREGRPPRIRILNAKKLPERLDELLDRAAARFIDSAELSDYQ